MGYLGTPPQSGFITTAKQRVTSSTNNYVDLDHSISSLADVIVWVNSVKQDSTNLSLTTSTRITLGGTLVSSDIVEIAYLGKAVNTQTPNTGTVTNDMLAGSIANSKLANSSISINGSSVSLGGSVTGIGSSNDPAWEVGLSSNQSIPNSTHTRLAMTVLRASTSSTYWDSTNYKTQNLTAGKYYAWFNLTAESDIGASTIYLQIRHFNSSDSQQAAATLAAADFHRENGAAVVGLFNVSSGDYLDYTFWQNSGSATDQIYEAGDGSTCRGGGFKLA